MNDAGQQFVQSLGDAPAEPAIETEEKEEASDSQTEEKKEDKKEDGEKKKEDGEGKEKKKTPFHKHPEWIKREKTWNKRLKDAEESTAKEIASMKQAIEERKDVQKELTESDIPEWFNGELADYKKYHKDQTKMIADAVGKAQKNITDKLDEKAGKDSKAVQEATQWFKDEVDRIENDEELNPSGDPIDQQALLEIARDNDLIDSQGRWNWKAAHRMLVKEQKPEKTEEEKEKDKKKKKKKEAAALDTKDSKADGEQDPIATSKSLKELDW